MKLRLSALLLVLVAEAGCYTVDVYAPKGVETTLLPASASVDTRRQWRTWYACFGVVQIDQTMPREVQAREHLNEVRVVVVDTVPDVIIGLFYNVLFPIGLGVQSIKIDGR